MLTQAKASRAIGAGFIFALATLGAACATDTKAEDANAASGSVAVSAEAAGEANAQAGAAGNVVPRLGGSVTAVGDYQIELAVHAGGLIKAMVFDAQGKVLSEHDEIDLALHLRNAAGAKQKVRLAFDTGCACFTGTARLDGKLSVQPIDISLGVAGHAHGGVLGQYSLLPDPPSLDLKAKVAPGQAQLDVAGTALASAKSGASVRALEPKASAQLKTNVQVPKPSLKLDVKPTATASARAGTEANTAKSSAGAKAKVGFSFGK